MPGRSSARSGRRAVAAVLVTACQACRHPAPEADPAAARARALAMLERSPTAGAVPVCQPADYVGAMTLTYPTLLRLAGRPVGAGPETAAWINPVELDDPSAQTLTASDGGGATATSARQAAATFLASPGHVVYRIDNVDAPLALGIKELKRGTVSARAIRYDARGNPRCAEVFHWQNDKARSDWAIERSNLAQVDPVIARALQDDLRAEYLAHAPGGPGAPAAVTARRPPGTPSSAPRP
jgi:hypothetical protein